MIGQLLRLLNTNNEAFLANPARVQQCLAVLIEVYNTELSTSELDRMIVNVIQTFRLNGGNFDQVNGQWSQKLDTILRTNPTTCQSPGASAPIQDILYRP